LLSETIRVSYVQGKKGTIVEGILVIVSAAMCEWVMLCASLIRQ